MRAWIQHLTARPLIWGGALLAGVLTVVLVAGLASALAPSGGSGLVAPTGARSTSPTPSPTPTASSIPSPTPTPTPSAEAPAASDPGPAPAPAAPAPVGDAPGREPGVIGMNPGAAESCGPTPSGQTVYLPFSYNSNPGNTVDIYYAYTDTDRQASGGFILLASGLPTNGTVSIPRTCPTDATGVYPLITVKVVARTPNGSATAFFSGI